MSNKSVEKYNILCRGRKIYTNLTEQEFFDILEDLSLQYYKTGSPNPFEIQTEIVGD
jgi:hypothetical protein